MSNETLTPEQAEDAQDELAVLAEAEHAKATEVTVQSEALIERANAILVRNAAEASEATEFLSEVARAMREGETARKFLVKPLQDHVKAINERFKGPAEVFTTARAIVQGKVLTYSSEVERQRAEVERAAREAAERVEREAAERRRAAEAEAQREREAAARATAAAEAQARAVTDEAQREEAERLAAVARQAEADARLAEELAANAPVIETPKVEIAKTAPLRASSGGSASVVKRWTYEIEDASRVPRQYLIVDPKLIAQAVKDDVREIPGVRIFQTAGLSVRA